MKKLFLFILGFHMTSQKIQTTELLILLSFYFHEVLQQLNTFIYTNFRIRKGLCCSREDTWISMLLRDAASSRRRGKLLCGLKTLPIFFLVILLSNYFLSQNKYYFIFMSSSSDEFTRL